METLMHMGKRWSMPTTGFYVIITGFNEPKPRQYMIYEVSGEALDELAEKNNFDLDYFRQ